MRRHTAAAIVLAAGGIVGVVLFAFFGPCEEEAGFETEFSATADAAFLAGPLAIGAAAAVAMRAARRGHAASVAVGVVAGLLAILAAFVVWANVCEGVRLDRF